MSTSSIRTISSSSSFFSSQSPSSQLLMSRDVDYTEREVQTLITTYNDQLPSPLPSHLYSLIETYLRSLLLTTPNYRPELQTPLPTLFTTSRPSTFRVSNGLQVTRSITKAIEQARHEVLFVTCFWAPSKSLTEFSTALLRLSARRIAEGATPIRVRIGFSSRTAWQKLFHTTSRKGESYPPNRWKTTLGLPTADEIPGIDLQIKSLFFLPFSVLHAKYTIIDRATLFLPSANISWECWLEQCSTFTGPIVDSFVSLFTSVWCDNSTDLPPLPPSTAPTPTTPLLPTLFLPHPHHRNPCLWFDVFGVRPPNTPQNTFTTTLLDSARNSIFLQSPNLTCRSIIHSLYSALERGVSVDLILSRKIMIIEQLITTGFTSFSEWEIWRMKRRIRRDKRRYPGRLRVWWYKGAENGRVRDEEEDEEEVMGGGEKWGRVEVEGVTRGTVKTHVKAIVVDGEITVLGSANADRASWWTSGEVGVAVLDKEWAREVRRGLVRGLGGRWEEEEEGGGSLGEAEEGREVQEEEV